MVEALVRQYLPHAPQLGLYVQPGIPGHLLRAAEDAFGAVLREPALALYDATRFGSAKDGALFGPTAFCFQNLVEAPQRIAYTELIRVWPEKKLLSGNALHLEVNRARALFSLKMDFAARADALPYVQRFFEAAIAESTEAELSDAGLGVDEALARLEAAAAADTLTAAQWARVAALAARG